MCFIAKYDLNMTIFLSVSYILLLFFLNIHDNKPGVNKKHLFGGRGGKINSDLTKIREEIIQNKEKEYILR